MRTTRAPALIGAICCAVVVLAAPAWAHGDEHVGEISIFMGFGAEPAYAGQPNSVQLLVSHDGAPVTGLAGAEVEVSFGDETVTLPLEPHVSAGGAPGDYRAWFVPSQPGRYTFSFEGTIEGEDVAVEMTSGPDTFSEVLSIPGSAFPPVDVPSADDLAARVEQESKRSAEARAEMEALVASATDDAARGRTLGLLGAAIGAAGGVIAVAAFAAARRRR